MTRAPAGGVLAGCELVAFVASTALDRPREFYAQVLGGARVAWFADPDGNTLSLTQFPAAVPGPGAQA